MKTILLEKIKEEMAESIATISFENIKESEQQISDYLQLVTLIDKLPLRFLDSLILNKIEDKMESHELPIVESEVEDTEQVEEGVYKFNRKLRGGHLEGTNILVPESITRQLILDHGDIIKPSYNPHTERYYFELIKKGNRVVNPERQQVSYGIVEKESSMLLVSTYLDNGSKRLVKVDENLHTFILNQDDILEFSIEPGDIVDIAYYSSNVKTVRVIYKYHIEEHENRPMPSTFYKTSNKKSCEEDDLTDSITFDNKTVLVVGCEPRQTTYQTAIEKRNGSMVWASGNESLDRLERLVMKADAVVMITTHMSHYGSKSTVKFCKEHNIPFTSIESRGIKSLVDAITNTLTHEKESA
ncbi:DUF2325 domain-containing protein [Ferdinandcohnia sp. SAFN-114]|uniref:DUF2325 domain-containing protein n=1 Tax=Ferdinandcohnia sp. SAFN-114 TaxID=3387275 RepID=UPI003F7D9734